MKNKKRLMGILAFAVCLWTAVVVAYGAQVKENPISGMKFIQLDDANCSSGDPDPDPGQ